MAQTSSVVSEKKNALHTYYFQNMLYLFVVLAVNYLAFEKTFWFTKNEAEKTTNAIIYPISIFNLYLLLMKYIDYLNLLKTWLPSLRFAIGLIMPRNFENINFINWIKIYKP